MLGEPSLVQRARAAELDAHAFLLCLSGEATHKVEEDRNAARALGVSGTPTFLFGKIESDSRVKVSHRLSGALPLGEFRSVLDQILKSS
jgi:predicted DsbA family dithiol-disulfide isomerase